MLRTAIRSALPCLPWGATVTSTGRSGTDRVKSRGFCTHTNAQMVKTKERQSERKRCGTKARRIYPSFSHLIASGWHATYRVIDVQRPDVDLLVIRVI